MNPASLATHLRRLLRASRIDPRWLTGPELFPKASTTRRNASRRLLGLSSFGRPYVRARWPELRSRRNHSPKSYHSAYMQIWRGKPLAKHANALNLATAVGDGSWDSAIKKRMKKPRTEPDAQAWAVPSYNLFTDSRERTMIVNTPSAVPTGK